MVLFPMPAGIQLRPGTPTALSDATTVEERDSKAPRFADPKRNGGRGKGCEGQASGSKDGGGNGNGGGAHQGMKRNYQPWGRTGGWKKDEWRDDWFSAKDGAAASSTDMQEVHKVLGMLQRLALRHEDSINLLKLEYSIVAHMKIGVPASVVAMLYVAADGWRKLKESEPAKLDRPMRTSLFVCFFAELKARLTGLEQKPDDVEKMAAMGWLNPGPPMTWAYLKWDQGNQRNVVDADKPPLRTAEILEQVDTLLANVVANNSLARFHPTRPLSSDMQGDNVVFLIQVPGGHHHGLLGESQEWSAGLVSQLGAAACGDAAQGGQAYAFGPGQQPGGDHQGLSYVWRHGTVAKATPAACGFLAQLIFMLSAVVLWRQEFCTGSLLGSSLRGSC